MIICAIDVFNTVTPFAVEHKDGSSLRYIDVKVTVYPFKYPLMIVPKSALMTEPELVQRNKYKNLLLKR